MKFQKFVFLTSLIPCIILFFYNTYQQIFIDVITHDLLILIILLLVSYFIIIRAINITFASQITKTYSGSKPGEYIPALNAIRFFGFLLVYLYHFPRPTDTSWYYQHFSFIQSKGWIGVDIFLVLSSFLLINLALHEKNDIGYFDLLSYFKRRCNRILPLYFIFISIFAYEDYKNHTFTANMGRHILSFVTFTVNYSYFADYSPPHDISHLWTISLEVQFYIIIAFLMLVKKNKLTLFLIFIYIVCIITKQYILYTSVRYPAIYMLTLPKFETLAVGGGVALLLHKRINIQQLSWFSEILVSIILIALFSLMYIITPNPESATYNNSIYTYIPSLIISVNILFLTYYNSHARKILSYKMFSYLGMRTYGMYVYHLLGIAFATSVVPPQRSNYFISIILGLLCTIILALLSYRVFERPFLRYGLLTI